MRAFSVTDDDNGSGTGEVVAVIPVTDGDDFIAVSAQGITIRLRADDISVQGRNARGVAVMNVERPDYVVGVAKLQENGDDENNGDEANGDDTDTNDNGDEAESEE